VSELILSAGKIPVVPYAKPGTQEMGDHLLPFLPEYRILVLKHHGALTWGESLEEALNGMERLEHSCEVFYKSKLMGNVQRLTDQEVNWLKEKRKQIGERIL
jgi:L-fuculose-phosphate aldolase